MTHIDYDTIDVAGAENDDEPLDDSGLAEELADLALHPEIDGGWSDDETPLLSMPGAQAKRYGGGREVKDGRLVLRGGLFGWTWLLADTGGSHLNVVGRIYGLDWQPCPVSDYYYEGPQVQMQSASDDKWVGSTRERTVVERLLDVLGRPDAHDLAGESDGNVYLEWMPGAGDETAPQLFVGVDHGVFDTDDVDVRLKPGDRSRPGWKDPEPWEALGKWRPEPGEFSAEAVVETTPVLTAHRFIEVVRESDVAVENREIRWMWLAALAGPDGMRVAVEEFGMPEDYEPIERLLEVDGDVA